MITPSRTAQAACDIILSRDAIGQAKYGHSMDRDDLKPLQWLQHAIEEHADALQYQIALGVRLEGVVRAAYKAGQDSVYLAMSADGCRGSPPPAADLDRIVKELLG